MKEFIFLLFAHHIGDIALQSEWIAINKSKYWFVMLWHSFIWTACICIVLEYFGVFTISKAVYLLVVHYAIDSWKCKYSKKLDEWHLLVDQLLHLIQLIMVM